MNKKPSHQPSRSPLLNRLGGAERTVENQLEAALGTQGLSVARLRALHQLAVTADPLTLGQLAERLACVRSNITQLVDRLEQDGLVQRTPDPIDRRSLRAMLTPEGRRRYEWGIKTQAQVEREMLRGLSAEEQQQLAALLAKFSPDDTGPMSSDSKRPMSADGKGPT